ncbi:hypothetical protein QWY31_03605 [Cytophagales bacterium LB-30]|uniref:Uncharacterized protein n=1 Tax=Shiella aurantiaca TaxID=3058365 RepID=A0ABT8F3J1_9BACT|nr:hypothetical protein [Shiella aurantiaca]MDN4164571.1 hypothetical protein [Shiella aurantiaca]
MTNSHKIFEFNYASFSMKPYAGKNGGSTKLLKEIVSKLRDKDFPKEKRIIDRHENRKNSISRKLVIISNHYEDTGKRIFGKLALIKNKAPLLWNKVDLVEEIEKEENKEFIEVTNYVIHLGENSDPVIMFEYNYEGPRLNDFEFYIRQIAKDFKIAKNINYSLHLNTNYNQLDKEIVNVFAITVKVNSVNSSSHSNWLNVLKDMNHDTGFKDVRLEFFYNRSKDKNGRYFKNVKGLSFAKKIISWLKNDGTNIDYLEDLKMTYQLNDEGEIVDLDFIKNKVVSMVKVPIINGKIYQNKDFKYEVGIEFNKYLKTGLTSTNFD